MLIDEATATRSILIPAICLWEVAMLAGRGRVELGRDSLSWMQDVLQLPGMSLAALDAEIAADTHHLPHWAHRDPADRMIVATTRRHAATLLTVDGAILDYAALGHVTATDARR